MAQVMCESRGSDNDEVDVTVEQYRLQQIISEKTCILSQKPRYCVKAVDDYDRQSTFLFVRKDRLTMHDPQNHIPFTEDIRNIKMAGVGTAMDDSIHVQVQMIKLGE